MPHKVHIATSSPVAHPVHKMSIVQPVIGVTGAGGKALPQLYKWVCLSGRVDMILRDVDRQGTRRSILSHSYICWNSSRFVIFYMSQVRTTSDSHF